MKGAIAISAVLAAFGAALSFEPTLVSGEHAPATTRASDPIDNLQKNALGDLPANLAAMSGDWSIRPESDGGENHVVEMSGDALEIGALAFGPQASTGRAEARVRSWATGKRCPEMGIAIGGADGWKLWLLPVQNKVELRFGDETRAAAEWNGWESSAWIHVVIEVRQAGRAIQVRAKVFPADATPPADWPLSIATDARELPAGRAVVFGTPFSERAIQFDDLQFLAE